MHPDSHSTDPPAPDLDAVGAPLSDSIPLALALFAFWAILSGKLDAFHLGFGALASIGVALASRGLFRLEPPIGPSGRDPFASIPWLRFLRYLPWLLFQIATASFQVAAIVLRPRIAIQPRLFRFRYPLPTHLAQVTLANSITLTPGTVTIDVLGDEYLVHALTDEAAAALEEPGPGSPDDMQARVGAIFSS